MEEVTLIIISLHTILYQLQLSVIGEYIRLNLLNKLLWHVFTCQIVCIINDYSYLSSTRTRQASQRCSNVRVVFVYIRSLSKDANGKILTFKYRIRVDFLILVSYFTPQRQRFISKYSINNGKTASTKKKNSKTQHRKLHKNAFQNKRV